MELEFFCAPGTELDWYQYWKEYCKNFVLSLGIHEENMRLREHEKAELSHYSNGTTDIEYKFPFGWGELWGVASRTNFDLSAHAKQSGQDLTYTDPFTNEKYVPYVIEPSVGVERMLLMLLCDAYDEETLENGDVRTHSCICIPPSLLIKPQFCRCRRTSWATRRARFTTCFPRSSW